MQTQERRNFLKIRPLMHKIVNFMLPPQCLVCRTLTQSPHQLCPQCWQKLSFIGEPRCTRCGYPLPYHSGETLCLMCYQTPPPFHKGRSILHYNTAIRTLILRLKHSDAIYLMPALGRWLVPHVQDMIQECDLLIPVPLSRQRMMQRGFNQAALLAEKISAAYHCPIGYGLLKRSRHTRPQALQKRQQRLENLKNAFTLTPKGYQAVFNKRICLVDDVWTTGTTITECTRILSLGLPKSISVITLARVVKGHYSHDLS